MFNFSERIDPLQAGQAINQIAFGTSNGARFFQRYIYRTGQYTQVYRYTFHPSGALNTREVTDSNAIPVTPEFESCSMPSAASVLSLFQSLQSTFSGNHFATQTDSTFSIEFASAIVFTIPESLFPPGTTFGTAPDTAQGMKIFHNHWVQEFSYMYYCGIGSPVPFGELGYVNYDRVPLTSATQFVCRKGMAGSLPDESVVV
jgi:hypothetical protein